MTGIRIKSKLDHSIVNKWIKPRNCLKIPTDFWWRAWTKLEPSRWTANTQLTWLARRGRSPTENVHLSQFQISKNNFSFTISQRKNEFIMGSINVFPFSCLTFLMGDKKTELIKKLKLLTFHERIPLDVHCWRASKS